MNVKVTPVFRVEERNRKEGNLENSRPVDQKIGGVVLAKITPEKGGLLAAVNAPHLTLGPIKILHRSENRQVQKKRSKLRKAPLPKRVPIGLISSDSEGWLNALMQFFLYVPGFAESFTFAPRSFFPIQEFIDQYHLDQMEGRSVSLANGGRIFELFHSKFPHQGLLEIFETVLFLLKPEWRLCYKWGEIPHDLMSSHLLIATASVKKQLKVERGQFYDLDLFIEKRPDGAKVNYYAYVKIDGCWYQCDDERITQVRSDGLTLALQRGILSHYKKISPGF